LTLKKIYHEFLEIEEDLHLFASKIGAVRFWEYLRFPIFNLIVQKATEQQAISRNRHTKRVTIKFYLSSLLNILKNPLFSRRKTILYYCSPRRQLRQDGSWWDIYTDFFIPETGLSYLAIESHFESIHKTPPRTKNLKYVDLLDFLFYITEKLRINRPKHDKETRVLLSRIQREIYRRFKVEINVEAMTSKILSARRIKQMYFNLLLRVVKPKGVVVVASYGKESLIEVSKSLRIPVIELQHGIISPYHTAYSFPGNDREKKSFPDYLFVFGDYWVSSAEFPIDKERIFSVGFPFLEYELRIFRNQPQKNQILIISQWTIGDQLSKFAVELSKEENHDYDIVFKLHPREYSGWRERYPWLINTSISVIDDNDTPLYGLFAESSIVVGGYSTALYEGLAFGLMTFLLDVPGIENLDHLIEGKYVKVVKSASQLLSIVRSRPNRTDFNREFFFRTEPRRRFAKLLNRIIQN